MRTYHDTTDAMAAIEAMAERLRDEYGAEAVILYGSRANGSARPDSDIDLLIIRQEDTGAIQRLSKVNAALADVRQGYWLDVLAATPEQVEDMLARGNHFIQDVILQGRALYENGRLEKFVALAKESYRMNPQDSDFPEYWIRIAEQDLRRVHRNLLDDDPEDAGFRLQQAAEKFFKAYLIRHGWRLVRTHSLGGLLNDALEYDADLERYRDVCELVSDYYFGGRYPSDSRFPETPDMSDAGVRAALAEIEPLLDLLRAGSAKPDSDGQDKQDDG